MTATATIENDVTVTKTGHPTQIVATRTHVVTKTFTPAPANPITDGTYLVGTDIKPGLWRTNGQGDVGGCYWERLKDLSGGIDSIIDNDNITGPTVVQISSSDRAFKASGGCEWRRSAI